jgi:hypothetical protein
MLGSTQAAYTATVTDAAARIGRTQSILNVGTGEVVTGVSSWNQAMHDAVRKMVDNGLTGFVDHGGHKWSPEAYVAMDVRTTMFNTARAAVWERAEQYGADLYQVSSHNGARPLCYPWQGKIISRSDWTGEVEDLEGNKVHVYAQSETSYGAAAGLFGVNCKHYPMTFIPGFSALHGEPQDPEENAEAYALSQQQRGMERKLREEKRDLAVMKAQGASEDEIRAQKERVNRASANIDDFCDEHDLPRRRSREYTPVRATWPDETTYDVTKFPTGTGDRMREWFKGNGDEPPPKPVNIHIGPDDIPPQGQAQIPIEPVDNRQLIDNTEASDSLGNSGSKGRPSYFKSFKGIDDISDENAEIIDARFKQLDGKYHARIENIGTTLGEEQRLYDKQLESRIQYEMEQNPGMRRKTAERKAVDLLGERPSLQGKGWLAQLELGGQYWSESPMYNNESLLTINPNALLDARDVSEDIIKRQRRIERNIKRVSEGKPARAFSNVTGSLEGSFIHEYGHAIDFTYGVAENDAFKAFYGSLTEEQRMISTYALTNEREFIAEAFAESFMGDTQGDISKQFMKILEGIVNGNP